MKYEIHEQITQTYYQVATQHRVADVIQVRK